MSLMSNIRDIMSLQFMFESKLLWKTRMKNPSQRALPSLRRKVVKPDQCWSEFLQGLQNWSSRAPLRDNEMQCSASSPHDKRKRWPSPHWPPSPDQNYFAYICNCCILAALLSSSNFPACFQSKFFPSAVLRSVLLGLRTEGKKQPQTQITTCKSCLVRIEKHEKGQIN